MRIEIAVDTIEADEFCEWLNLHGHQAIIGNSTGNYIDGIWTSVNEDANEKMRDLWDDFCNH
jgi:hypothetical protein